jgi:hypothetical protein
MVTHSPDPYIICRNCRRLNFLSDEAAPALLRERFAYEVLKCRVCRKSESYSSADVLPIVKPRQDGGMYGGQLQIYMIVNNCNGLVYIGQTTKSLHERMTQHESLCRNLKPDMTRLHRDMARIGFQAFDMILVERIGAGSCALGESEDRERHYISLLDTCDPAKGYNCSKCESEEKLREVEIRLQNALIFEMKCQTYQDALRELERREAMRLAIPARPGFLGLA